MKKPELLCPAGDFERLQAAVRFGADAVYLAGKQFGMRTASANFDEDGLIKAVQYAHAQGVRVYVTCNTLPHNEEIPRIPAFLRMLEEIGADAVIVADLGVLAMAREYAPGLEVHISTQTGVVNYAAAQELHRLGAKRIVLAREMSLEEIRVLRENTPDTLELEAFCHGAMCMSFSGRCVISNFLTGRDPNRGACSQPCRWGYYLMEERRPGEYFPVFEDERGSFILSAKDLSMIEYLDKMIEAGVCSLKIEGRAKSAYYVAGVTAAYRSALDAYFDNPVGYLPPKWALEEVDKVSHRAYSTGFYFGRPEQGQNAEDSSYIREWEVVAAVDGWEDGMLLCREKNRFSDGEELEVLSPGTPPFSLRVHDMQDGEGVSLAVACHPEMALRIPCQTRVREGGFLRRRTLPVR